MEISELSCMLGRGGFLLLFSVNRLHDMYELPRNRTAYTDDLINARVPGTDVTLVPSTYIAWAKRA